MSPISAKVSEKFSFIIGYIAGTTDCIMSFRKCEMLIMTSIEYAVPSAIWLSPFSLLVIDFNSIVYSSYLTYFKKNDAKLIIFSVLKTR